MNVIPTPEQMDAHERAHWAAWHEQHRQPAPEQDTCPAREQAEIEFRARDVAANGLLVFAICLSACWVLLQFVDVGPSRAGPHLKLDLKIAGVPQ